MAGDGGKLRIYTELWTSHFVLTAGIGDVDTQSSGDFQVRVPIPDAHGRSKL